MYFSGSIKNGWFNELTHDLEPWLQLFSLGDISVSHGTTVLTLVRIFLSVREGQFTCYLTVLVGSEVKLWMRRSREGVIVF